MVKQSQRGVRHCNFERKVKRRDKPVQCREVSSHYYGPWAAGTSKNAAKSIVVQAASGNLRNLFQKKQLVVVTPLLAKQNNVSPSSPIASFVAPKLNLG